MCDIASITMLFSPFLFGGGVLKKYCGGHCNSSHASIGNNLQNFRIGCISSSFLLNGWGGLQLLLHNALPGIFSVVKLHRFKSPEHLCCFLTSLCGRILVTFMYKNYSTSQEERINE